MNTFAAAHSIGARPRAFQRKSRPRLDEEARIFLVGECAVALLATVLAGIGWVVATSYNAPWAMWQSRMMMLVAAWAAYLVLKAWASQLLSTRKQLPLEIESDFVTGD